MNRKVLVLFLLILSMVVFVSPLNAGGPADVSHFVGKSASGVYGIFCEVPDFTGTTIVVIVAGDNQSKENSGPANTPSEITVSIHSFGSCPGSVPLDVSTVAPLAAQDFRLAANLSTASLKATVDVCDSLSNSCFPLSVDVTWTSFGPAGRITDFSHSHQSQGVITNIHLRGVSQTANTSGSIVGGPINLHDLGGSEIFAAMGFLVSGTVEVYTN